MDKKSYIKKVMREVYFGEFEKNSPVSRFMRSFNNDITEYGIPRHRICRDPGLFLLYIRNAARGGKYERVTAFLKLALEADIPYRYLYDLYKLRRSGSMTSMNGCRLFAEYVLKLTEELQFDRPTAVQVMMQFAHRYGTMPDIPKTWKDEFDTDPEEKKRREAEKIIKRAENGGAEAKAAAADIYYNGDGVKQDFNAAFQWAQKADEIHMCPKARVIMGLYYDKNSTIEGNKEKALEMLRTAASRGDAHHIFLYAKKLEKYDRDNENAELCFKLMKKANQFGSTNSYLALAIYYIDGYGTEKNVDKAIAVLKRGAEKERIFNCADLLSKIYSNYYEDTPEYADRSKYLKYLELAFRLKPPSFARELADEYSKSDDFGDMEKAAYYFGVLGVNKSNKAFETSDYGMKYYYFNTLAENYYNGTFVPGKSTLGKWYSTLELWQDKSSDIYTCRVKIDHGKLIARRWYEEGILGGYPDPRTAYCVLTEKSGTELLDEYAEQEFLRVTEGGAESCVYDKLLLARILAEHSGSSEKLAGYAVKLYEMLAETGNNEARAELGKIYLYGDIVAKDTNRAIGLLKDAAAAGHPKAGIYLADAIGSRSRKTYRKALHITFGMCRYLLEKTGRPEYAEALAIIYQKRNIKEKAQKNALLATEKTERPDALDVLLMSSRGMDAFEYFMRLADILYPFAVKTLLMSQPLELYKINFTDVHYERTFFANRTLFEWIDESTGQLKKHVYNKGCSGRTNRIRYLAKLAFDADRAGFAEGAFFLASEWFPQYCRRADIPEIQSKLESAAVYGPRHVRRAYAERFFKSRETVGSPFMTVPDAGKALAFLNDIGKRSERTDYIDMANILTSLGDPLGALCMRYLFDPDNSCPKASRTIAPLVIPEAPRLPDRQPDVIPGLVNVLKDVLKRTVGADAEVTAYMLFDLLPETKYLGDITKIYLALKVGAAEVFLNSGTAEAADMLISKTGMTRGRALLTLKYLARGYGTDRRIHIVRDELHIDSDAIKKLLDGVSEEYRSFPDTLGLYRELAMAGCPEACRSLGRYCDNETMYDRTADEAQCKAAALKYYKMGAALGDTECKAYLGKECINSSDETYRAAWLLTEAASEGSYTAEYFLEGFDGAPNEGMWERAAEWLERSGDPEDIAYAAALRDRHTSFNSRSGVWNKFKSAADMIQDSDPPDAKSVSVYRLAAMHGYRPAMKRLAEIYLTPVMLPGQAEHAALWYERLGSGYAYKCLCELHLNLGRSEEAMKYVEKYRNAK